MSRADEPRNHTESPAEHEPPATHWHLVDPDVDLHDPAQRAETSPREWDLLAAMAAGGVLGAEARYGVGLALPHGVGFALPHGAHSFPWATVLVNASGCLLIGVLMVVLLELTRWHRLLRPFLGVGVLGGYTTYSTFAADAQRLIRSHQPGIALAYVVVTVLACLGAVWVGTVATRWLGRRVCRTEPAPVAAR
jgi:CrcB protein